METQRLDSGIVRLFSVTLLSHLLLCASLDRITPGQFISSNGTLVSDGGAFMMGFFSPSNSSGDIYVGIWYNIPQRTVVWVANREKSINDSSAAVLSIAEDSNLIINDSRGITIWSSSLSGLGAPSNSTELVLLNSGNLVLRKSKNRILWQSFDHPTDTFLLGMNIGFNYVNTHPPVIFFTSWMNANDPSPGKFSFGIDSNAHLQLFTWRGSMIYWRSQVWDGNLMGRASSLNFNSMIYLTLTRQNDGFSLSLSVGSFCNRRPPPPRLPTTHSLSLLKGEERHRRWELIGCVQGSRRMKRMRGFVPDAAGEEEEHQSLDLVCGN